MLLIKCEQYCASASITMDKESLNKAIDKQHYATVLIIQCCYKKNHSGVSEKSCNSNHVNFFVDFKEFFS